MAKAQDFSKTMQDMMGSFPMDATAFQDMFKTQTALAEKMTKVALEAAEKSTEISTKWTRDALAKFGTVAKAKSEATDYTKALTDFASNASEMAAESLAAYAEVAKKVQMETVELMLAAGKDISEDATAVVKKATADVTAAAKKVTDDVSYAAKKATDDATNTVRKATDDAANTAKKVTADVAGR